MVRSSFLGHLTVKLIGLLLLCYATSHGQQSPRMLLDRLQGSWHMTGTVMKKPVTYTAEGGWILQNQFFSLHMRDAALPPGYEANLFIGIDSSKNQYVAHWLDSFGGAGARVVGIGPLSAQRIEVVYPYPEGRFRNSLSYDPRNGEWILVIESETAETGWTVFAEYTMTRN